MKRLLLIGLILGIATGTALLGFVQPLDHVYRKSVARVAPNGGRVEVFQIELPGDRLLSVSGDNVAQESVPAGVQLPAAPRLENVRVEAYFLRDAERQIIGVASRLSDAEGSADDWTLYMPARGAMFLSGDEAFVDDIGQQAVRGLIVGGSESMSENSGQFIVRRIAPTDTDDKRRIEIETIVQAAGS